MTEDEFNKLTKSMMLEEQTFKYSRLRESLSSVTTTVRLYDEQITLQEMDVVNDNPAIHCLVIEANPDLEKAENKLKVKEEDKQKNFDLIFVNNSFSKEFAEIMNYPIDTSNILKKEDVVNEPTKILVG